MTLGGLNAAFHGKLVDEFTIPGSDVQKATDPVNAKFGGQRGAALRVVLAAPQGQRLDTPRHQAAIRQMLAAGHASQASVDETAKDVGAIANPLDRNAHQLSRSGRIAFFDVRYGQNSFKIPRPGIVNVENTLRSICQKAGIDTQFTGEAENAPVSSSGSEIIGMVAAFVVLLILFRALVPTAIPLLFAITAVAGAFMQRRPRRRRQRLEMADQEVPGRGERPMADTSSSVRPPFVEEAAVRRAILLAATSGACFMCCAWQPEPPPGLSGEPGRRASPVHGRR